MIQNFTITLATLSFTGCASIINDSTQPMKIETNIATGDTVNGAECMVTNDYGSITTKSGDTALVHRSSKDVDIVCKHPQNPQAVARVISRVNAGLAGNIVAGGVIGAIIDHNKGTAYTYPTWVRLVFGQSLVFDRLSERDGQPTNGTLPVAIK